MQSSASSGSYPIRTVLIANRGEIALRIIRTCQKLGIRAVAVYSEADKALPYVQAADLAIGLGGNTATETYLDANKILAVALGNDVQAIHPGYGFLSENAAFAEACLENSIHFIGPSSEVIRVMGDKGKARSLMQQAGLNVLAGYSEADQPSQPTIEQLQAAATQIGFPVLIKALSGGGGRGIRLVERAEDLPDQIAAVRRETLSAFGDDRILLEQFLPNAQHLEVQIIGDQHGQVTHLCERVCSVQRKRQKLIEEAPSMLSAEHRERLLAQAIQGAQAVNYVNAGTMEFLQGENGQCFFMEMNPRLQVEHPVTEAILGIDLVALQLHIAAGLPLNKALSQVSTRPTASGSSASSAQSDSLEQLLQPQGHAIECRLTAESVPNGFLPSVGPIWSMDLPHSPNLHHNASLHSPNLYNPVRLDAGYQAGNQVSPFYDSLLSKLIVWGPTREATLLNLQQVLAKSWVTGVETNLAFLRATVQHPDFVLGQYDTSFVEKHEQTLCAPVELDAHARSEQSLALAAVEAMLEVQIHAATDHTAQMPVNPFNQAMPSASFALTTEYADRSQPDKHVPSTSAIAVHGTIERVFAVEDQDPMLVQITIAPCTVQTDQYTQWPFAITFSSLDGLKLQASVRTQLPMQLIQCGEETAYHGNGWLVLENLNIPFRWVCAGEQRWVALRDNPFVAQVHPPRYEKGSQATQIEPGLLRAVLPGKIAALKVSSGQSVEAGQLLAVLEAMKMEHPIVSSTAGTVAEVCCEVGWQVKRGDLLIRIDSDDV